MAANAPGVFLHSEKRTKFIKDARAGRNRSEIAVSLRVVVRRIRWGDREEKGVEKRNNK